MRGDPQMEVEGLGNVSAARGSMVIFPSSQPHKVHRVVRTLTALPRLPVMCAASVGCRRERGCLSL